MIIFPKGYHYLESVMQLQFDVVGIDWTTGIREAAELAEKYGKAIQGNLDPAILYSSEETIRTLANDMMSQMP